MVATGLAAAGPATAQGYGYPGRGAELSLLLRTYFPAARQVANGTRVGAERASAMVRAASGGKVISVRTVGNTHVVKVLTKDTPPKMQTYRVDATTGEIRR